MGPLLQQLQAAATQASGQGDAKNANKPDFGEALMHSIDRIDALKQTAISAGHTYELGTPGVSLNEVMVDIARADIATSMGIQARNRVVNAYKDIMNMQV
jgi:flagellar hook-basal body complex protein FliE